jgi:hypothetical protein
MWMVTTDDRGFVKYWQSNFNNVHTFQAHAEPVKCSRWESCHVTTQHASDRCHVTTQHSRARGHVTAHYIITMCCNININTEDTLEDGGIKYSP